MTQTWIIVTLILTGLILSIWMIYQITKSFSEMPTTKTGGIKLRKIEYEK
jgi:hypothetical protein